MTLDQYIDNINKRYKLGNATEHTFRGDRQQLLECLVPDTRATNEPKRHILAIGKSWWCDQANTFIGKPNS